MPPALRIPPNRPDRVFPRSIKAPGLFLFGGHMTKEQKEFILKSRQKGKSYAEIAEELKLSPHTVKSVCMRNKQVSQKEAAASACKQCGAPLKQIPHHKAKNFCSDKCRLAWWHDHRDQAKNARVHICPTCGSTFSGDTTRKYCCHRCYIKARYA